MGPPVSPRERAEDSALYKIAGNIVICTEKCDPVECRLDAGRENHFDIEAWKPAKDLVSGGGRGEGGPPYAEGGRV